MRKSKSLRSLLLMLSFLLTTANYAQNAFKSAEPDTARVFITFLVETSGEITNAKVTRVECEGCKRKYIRNIKSEALRVINSMDKWDPIEKRAKVKLPIKFVSE